LSGIARVFFKPIVLQEVQAMTRSTRRAVCQLLPILLAAWCTGCGGGGAGGGDVNGTVTLDGTAIEDGSISFTPETGEGGTAGGKIVQGKYSVKGVATGKNRVHIETGGSKRSAREARAERGKESKEAAAPNPTAGAQGNDQSVDIAPGSQTKDIQLQKGGGS
jgi:hypothetical protein